MVDDDRDILDTLRIILESNGYGVRTAENGRQALKALEERLPVIMILDIMMASDTEGFDLAYKLRDEPAYRNLPIIMLTSFMDKVRREGPGPFEYILGRNACPVDFRETIELIRVAQENRGEPP